MDLTTKSHWYGIPETFKHYPQVNYKNISGKKHVFRVQLLYFVPENRPVRHSRSKSEIRSLMESHAAGPFLNYHVII